MHALSQYLLSVLLFAAIGGAAAKTPFPSGPAQAEVIHFQFAVYYPAPPTTEPLATLRAAARARPGLALVSGALPGAPAGMLVGARIEQDVPKNYAVPGPESLKYFARGLSARQTLDLQKTRQALILDFSHPKKHTMEALRAAYALTEQVARKTGGLLWDEQTRQVFTPASWHEQRLAKWRDGVPDIAANISIHVYQDGKAVRAISLGMGKFGLPDIAAEQLSWSNSRPMGTVISLLGQSLAEGAVVGENGQIDVDITRIAHQQVRDGTLKTIKGNPDKVARLILLKAARQEGDPANRIAALSYARYPGPDPTARQVALLSAMFGTEDEIKHIKHNNELTKASELARQKLLTMEARFQQGLRPAEFILVKAPFKTTSGGTEWMWVEIRKWDGDKIEGVLTNTPFNVPSLRAGQSVRIRLGNVFDYIHVLPDGTREGNTTGKIIEQMQGQTRN